MFSNKIWKTNCKGKYRDRLKFHIVFLRAHFLTSHDEYSNKQVGSSQFSTYISAFHLQKRNKVYAMRLQNNSTIYAPNLDEKLCSLILTNFVQEYAFNLYLQMKEKRGKSYTYQTKLHVLMSKWLYDKSWRDDVISSLILTSCS